MRVHTTEVFILRLICSVAATTCALALSAPSFAQRPYEPGFSYESGSVHLVVRPDATYTVSQENIWRVNTQQGISEAGVERVRYVSSQDEVESVEGWTIQPDGSQLAVPADMIRNQEEGTEGGATEFGDVLDKTIIFPKVQVGSRVRALSRINHHATSYPGYLGLSYTLTSAYKRDGWDFSVDMPAGMPLYIEQRGLQGGLVGTDNGLDHYRFHHQNASAVPAEEGSLSQSDTSDVLRLSTYRDPIALGQAYQQASRPMAQVTPAIRTQALSITAGLKSDAARVKALHHWVAGHIRYVSVSLGAGGLVPHPADQVLANLYGDCKDHAILLEALLTAVGIPSSPALINLGSSYQLSSVGIVAPLNHVITYLPSLDLYVDATNAFAPYGSLWFEELDKPTVLTALGRIGHTPRMSAQGNTTHSTQTLTIEPDGTLAGTSRTLLSGVPEVESRFSRFEEASTDEEKVVRYQLYRFSETGTGTVKHAVPNDLDAPYWIESTFRLDPVSNFPGPGALKVPVGLSTGSLAALAVTQPLARRRDAYPCQSQHIDEHYDIAFPAGAVITHIPDAVIYNEGGIEYRSSYVRKDATVTVHRVLVEQHPGSVCTPQDHEAWKRFFAVLQRDLRGQVMYR